MCEMETSLSLQNEKRPSVCGVFIERGYWTVSRVPPTYQDTYTSTQHKPTSLYKPFVLYSHQFIDCIVGENNKKNLINEKLVHIKRLTWADDCNIKVIFF